MKRLLLLFEGCERNMVKQIHGSRYSGDAGTHLVGKFSYHNAFSRHLWYVLYLKKTHTACAFYRSLTVPAFPKLSSIVLRHATIFLKLPVRSPACFPLAVDSPDASHFSAPVPE